MRGKEFSFLGGGRSGVALSVAFFVFLVSFYFPLSSKAINNIFYAFIAIPCVGWLLWKPRALPVFLAGFAWLFVAIAGLVVFCSSELADLKKIIYMVLFFSACMLLWVEGYLERVIFGFAVFSTLLFLIAAAECLWQGFFGGSWSRYAVFLGWEINPVYWGLSIVSGWAFLWVFYFDNCLSQRSRLAFLLGFAFLNLMVLMCVLVFQSRSALLGYLGFLFFYALRGGLFWFGSLVVAFLAAALYFSGWGELLLERGMSYRLDIWVDAVRRVVSECGIWLGCGADDYRFLGQFYHPHSSYVSVFYKGGIGGVVFLLGFALTFFAVALKGRSRWLGIALIGWGGLIATGNGMVSSPKPFWIYFWIPTLMAVLEVRGAVVKKYLDARKEAEPLGTWLRDYSRRLMH
ncbi:hypothetical protein KRX52_12350 [Pseudomonas sp. MAP12]|uniref:O-antigen polymerase n=1 Tax=Geopseudomonas aromaticivorans TaxID=2849492 RepID=A0ABS6MXQ3_9GAMM|nr:hypothetical protein [Pseudomonas aromaticivorans]MBV2133583.1 hypothetical protein [Pseudomonas aromaticivorans]